MSNKIKLQVVMMIVVLISAINAFAVDEYFAENLTLARIRVQEDFGLTFVGTNTQPEYTCKLNQEYFKLDHTTPDGKGFLATLLAAKMGGKTVQIWYSASSAPGTISTNGCTITTISELVGVAIP